MWCTVWLATHKKNPIKIYDMAHEKVQLKSMRWFSNPFSLLPPERMVCVKKFLHRIDSDDFSSVPVIVDPWPSDLVLLVIFRPFPLSHLPAWWWITQGPTGYSCASHRAPSVERNTSLREDLDELAASFASIRALWPCTHLPGALQAFLLSVMKVWPRLFGSSSQLVLPATPPFSLISDLRQHWAWSAPEQNFPPSRAACCCWQGQGWSAKGWWWSGGWEASSGSRPRHDPKSAAGGRSGDRRQSDPLKQTWRLQDCLHGEDGGR